MARYEHSQTDPVLLERARELRSHITPAEAILWLRLRNRAVSGAKFRRQEVIGPYIADFVCESLKLVIEVDGYSHEGRIDYDINRTRYFEEHGYRVIRFTNEDVRDRLDGVWNTIAAICNNGTRG